ncbi:MAG: glycosyltransferase family 2 protein [Actinobacteria bacterium]|nr:MAG: glycosyltransferase family 2 protein [Actinomycetota bacterium]
MPSHRSHEAPPVTAVVPARNEENAIAAALTSILEQDYAGPLDVVVAVAPSTDDTLEILNGIAATDDRVSVVDNPAGTTPAGLNAAIAVATGGVIVRCDAHAEIPAGYVTAAVRTLEATGAVNVGGVQRAVGIDSMQRAIAAAMSSPFGVGDARFHMGGEAGFVDTVYLGVFRRDALDAVGGFDETLIRNQDYELNYRLRQAGGGIYFDPSLRVTYRPRSTLRGLWKQYYEYGRWKRVVIQQHPGSVRWRQFVPPAFVAGLGLSGIATVTGHRKLAAIVPGAYVAATITTTVAELARRRDRAALFLPAVFPTMHIAWGLGFLTPGQPSSSDA